MASTLTTNFIITPCALHFFRSVKFPSQETTSICWRQITGPLKLSLGTSYASKLYEHLWIRKLVSTATDAYIWNFYAFSPAAENLHFYFIRKYTSHFFVCWGRLSIQESAVPNASGDHLSFMIYCNAGNGGGRFGQVPGHASSVLHILTRPENSTIYLKTSMLSACRKTVGTPLHRISQILKGNFTCSPD